MFKVGAFKNITKYTKTSDLSSEDNKDFVSDIQYKGTFCNY